MNNAGMKFDCIFEEPLAFIDIEYTALNKTIRYEKTETPKHGTWKERTINVPEYLLECPFCEWTWTETRGRWAPLYCGGCGARLKTKDEEEDEEELEGVGQ